MINWDNFLIASGLCFFAGISTGIGSALAFFARKTNTRMLSASLGFSAGVMIYVSLVEIFQKARFSLESACGPEKGYWLTVTGFFAGIAAIALIDWLIPESENPHEIHDASDSSSTDKNNLYRAGIFTGIALMIHNFPEGLATFTAAMQDPTLGLPIAIAIAIHNIPEGIAVSIPIFYATGDRKKAFWFSFLSGLAEPVGAILGFLLLMPFFNETVFGMIFASVAGIMVYISLDELLPSAEKYGHHHLCIYGVISGMAVMALSLLLLS